MIPRKAKREKMSWVLNWPSDFSTESEFFSLYSADHGQEVRLRETANFFTCFIFSIMDIGSLWIGWTCLLQQAV